MTALIDGQAMLLSVDEAFDREFRFLGVEDAACLVALCPEPMQRPVSSSPRAERPRCGEDELVDSISNLAGEGAISVRRYTSMRIFSRELGEVAKGRCVQ